ncbi:MAG: hypothetical protein GEU75_05410 [Dehalococcoidia bacterium]|nr:hypothetical protein [Dehalococcoidia bacterium]
MLRFTDQRERLRRTVRNALDGCEYRASREEKGGRLLMIEARRGDGRVIVLRFRGVKEADASQAPEPGSTIRLLSVGSPSRLALIGLFVPILRLPGEDYARVRIEIGAARLDIVCQDAEWWEDDAAPDVTGEAAT